ncbi:MAG: hypothetical protein OHK0022_28100 [Roseiflexaceae bacterium]
MSHYLCNTQASEGIETGVIPAPRAGVLGALEQRLDYLRRSLRAARRLSARRAMRRAGRQIQAVRAALAWQIEAEVEQLPRGHWVVRRPDRADHLIAAATWRGGARSFFCACAAGSHCPAAHLVAAVEAQVDVLEGV